jgi:hypothetical protein
MLVLGFVFIILCSPFTLQHSYWQESFGGLCVVDIHHYFAKLL